MKFKLEIVKRAILISSLLSARSVNCEAECENGLVDANLDATGWPEMWRLSSDDPEDPQSRNEGAKVDPDILSAAGVTYRQIDPSGYNYPADSGKVEWFADEETGDPTLANFRKEANYTFADILSVPKLIPSFWDEHLHEYSTIRYILNGSGYFDLRDVDDNWVRMHVKTGDFMEWPAGIDHRFTVDDNNFITAMRLFKGSPEWTSFPRTKVLGNNTARTDYVDMYLCGNDPDLPVLADATNDPDLPVLADATNDPDLPVLADATDDESLEGNSAVFAKAGYFASTAMFVSLSYVISI